MKKPDLEKLKTSQPTIDATLAITDYWYLRGLLEGYGHGKESEARHSLDNLNDLVLRFRVLRAGLFGEDPYEVVNSHQLVNKRQ